MRSAPEPPAQAPEAGRPSVITKPIWILSLVSLFADIASEMLYPVMPMYLSSIGFSVALIGVLEGVAEATASFSKGWFGSLSDKTGRRAPFIRAGYLLSAVSKPMMAVLTVPLWVFSARTVDRLGKGVRTAARDALLAHYAPEGRRGEVFGFHRRMDTIGASIGPIIALVFLYYLPGEYRFLFFAAFLPGMASVGLTLFVREHKSEPVAVRTSSAGSLFFQYFRGAPPAYKKLVLVLTIFALVNSSDAFLLLAAKKSGLTDYEVILAYIFYNFVFAAAAHPLGKLADRIGFRKSYAGGLLMFAVTYAGIGMFPGAIVLGILFFCYGMYAGATEGISKAWVAQIVPDNERGRALGTFGTAQSLATIAASTTAGALWTWVSPTAPFILASMGAALVAVILFLSKLPETAPKTA